MRSTSKRPARFRLIQRKSAYTVAVTFSSARSRSSMPRIPGASWSLPTRGQAALPRQPRMITGARRSTHGSNSTTTDWIPLEIKSASEFTRGKWGPTGTDDAPTYYCTQMHWQIGLSGAPFGRIVALLGADDLRVYTIQRDEQVLAFLRNAADEFWQRVLERKPPPLDYQHPRAGECSPSCSATIDATEILQGTTTTANGATSCRKRPSRRKQYEAVRDGAKRICCTACVAPRSELRRRPDHGKEDDSSARLYRRAVRIRVRDGEKEPKTGAPANRG
jgi:hypothetical protein